MSQFSNLMNTSKNNFNDWYGSLRNQAGNVQNMDYMKDTMSADEFAKAVVTQMMEGANAKSRLNPTYYANVIKKAPEILLLQDLESWANYGKPAGNDFNQFFANWMGPGNGSSAPRNNYGWGDLSANDMNGTWRNFVNKYQQAMNEYNAGNQSTLSALLDPQMVQELQGFQNLAINSNFGPLGGSLMSNVMNNNYTNWAQAPGATWLDFLKQYTNYGAGLPY
jgi:hypothetical protein